MNITERIERLESLVGIEDTDTPEDDYFEGEPDTAEPDSRLDDYREHVRERTHELLAQAQSQADRKHQGISMLAAERVQAYENVLKFL